MEILCETKKPVSSNMRQVKIKREGSDVWEVVYMSSNFLDKIEATVKSIDKYGNNMALFLAIEFRKNGLEKDKDYTERHGK